MEKIQEFDKLKTKVLKYILYKKRTEQEIRKKFENEIEENILEDIIEYLKQTNYINDNEYITKTINDFKLLKNLSIKEVTYKLLNKGINKNELETYMYENKEKMEEYEITSISNIIYKKRNIMDKETIINYLTKKGYKYDNIKKVLEGTFEE